MQISGFLISKACLNIILLIFHQIVSIFRLLYQSMAIIDEIVLVVIEDLTGRSFHIKFFK